MARIQPLNLTRFVQIEIFERGCRKFELDQT